MVGFLHHSLFGHTDRVFDVRLCPHKHSLLASASQDGSVLLWDISRPTPTPQQQQHAQHQQQQQRITLCADPSNVALRVCWSTLTPQTICAGFDDGLISLWDGIDLQQPPRAPQLQLKCTDQVYGLCFSDRKKNHLFTGSGDIVQCWDIAAGGACMAQHSCKLGQQGHVFGGHTRNPNHDVFVFNISHFHSLCATACSDGTIRILDSDSLTHIHTFHTHIDSAVSCVSLSDNTLFAVSATGEMSIFDTRIDRANSNNNNNNNANNNANTVQFSRDQVQAHERNCFSCVTYDANTNTDSNNNNSSNINSSNNNNSSCVATCGGDGLVRLWRNNEHDVIGVSGELQHHAPVLCCDVMPTGVVVCAGDSIEMPLQEQQHGHGHGHVGCSHDLEHTATQQQQQQQYPISVWHWTVDTDSIF